MPHFDIIRECKPERTFRVESVIGTFDLQTDNVTEHFVGDIDLPEVWHVGLIVGHSGSGKSTIARELFGDNIVEGYEYTHGSILDDMPKNASVREISMALNSVGFSSPPSWLKPYAVLSNGEKMRCDIARAMLENRDFFVFDEFTSVVDRNVAQISSFAIQKAVRRSGRRFVAVTCHYDVQNWLMPDWVYNTDTMTFQTIDAETQKKNRPAIKLEIREIKHDKSKIWGMFAKYPYLSHSFNPAARTFVCYANEHLAGFTSVLHFMHPKKKNTVREHRTVVLPDFQGVGIGGAMTSAVADYFQRAGKVYITTTSNPAMIVARSKDPRWAMTRRCRVSSGSGLIQNKYKRGSTSCARNTCAFEWMGEKRKSFAPVASKS
jgi:ABC-type polar amino acid transport system ATPase subunit/predicted GNAT family acetyltransferase